MLETSFFLFSDHEKQTQSSCHVSDDGRIRTQNPHLPQDCHPKVSVLEGREETETSRSCFYCHPHQREGHWHAEVVFVVEFAVTMMMM